MEATTSNLVRKATREYDAAIRGVINDPSWHGFARLEIKSADLTPKQEAFAEELSRRLLDNGKTADAEKAGRVSVKKAKEKLDQ